MSEHTGSSDTNNYTPQQVAEILVEKAHLRHRVESMSEEIAALQRRGLEKSRLLCEALEREKRLQAEVARLREAIKREAKKHISGEAGVSCCCDLCDIAREGR